MARQLSPHWLRSFLISTAVLALVAGMLSHATEAHYLLCLAMVFSTALFTALIVAIVSAGWFFDRNSRRGQFWLSWLFLLSALLAVYLSIVRWLLVARQSNQPPSAEVAVEMALRASAVFVFLFPAALYFGEPFLWLAVWVVRAARGSTLHDEKSVKKK